MFSRFTQTTVLNVVLMCSLSSLSVSGNGDTLPIFFINLHKEKSYGVNSGHLGGYVDKNKSSLPARTIQRSVTDSK